MSSKNTSDKRTNWVAFLPVAIFIVLAVVFTAMLMQPGRDAATIPSALIGQDAPSTALPAVEGMTIGGFDPASFEGVTLVNFWASWCAPCRQEHPLLVALAEDERITVAGVNYKDKPAQARQFLAELGNPYDVIGADATGRTGIEWGVYGMPETFIVAPDGTIAWKHVGPLSKAIVTGEMAAIIRQLAGE